MTRDEVAIMLGTIREIYGKQGDSPNPEFTIALWHRYLSDEPTELVQQAMDKHIASSIFAPKPVEILALIEEKKSALWADSVSVSLFGAKKRRLPDEYLPRHITRKPKAYELENEARLLKRLGGADIGKLPEGRKGDHES